MKNEFAPHLGASLAHTDLHVQPTNAPNMRPIICTWAWVRAWGDQNNLLAAKHFIVAHWPEIERLEDGTFSPHCHEMMRQNSAVTAQLHSLESLDNAKLKKYPRGSTAYGVGKGGEDTILSTRAAKEQKFSTCGSNSVEIRTSCM